MTREQSLQAGLDQSSARIDAWLAIESSAPDASLIRQEQAVRLAHALAELTEDQRQAIEHHHLRGRPVAEVADSMGRSPGADRRPDRPRPDETPRAIERQRLDVTHGHSNDDRLRRAIR